MKLSTLVISLIALLSGIIILLFLNESTLYLASLFLSIIMFKGFNPNFDKIVGVWLALCVAPAFGVTLDQIQNLSNGFVIQSSLSFLLFLGIYTKKPSIIGRLYHNTQLNGGIIASSIIAGFSAGIISAVIWQFSLQLQLL